MPFLHSKVIIFLENCYSAPISNLSNIGQGTWSQCFGYTVASNKYVIRFGKYQSDFTKDRYAAQFRTSTLPIPKFYSHGKAFDDYYYAISQRKYGTAIESLTSSDWNALIPNLVDVFEELRCIKLPVTIVPGDWDFETSRLIDQPNNWVDFLLRIECDNNSVRMQGWGKKLDHLPQAKAVFRSALSLLKETADPNVRLSIVHGDLLNRNVLSKNNRVSGIFDWGCGMFGDHLYDLALLKFWNPWCPHLDMNRFSSALEKRWEKNDYKVINFHNRLLACHLHIGLRYIAYYTAIGNTTDLKAIVSRLSHFLNSGN